MTIEITMDNGKIYFINKDEVKDVMLLKEFGGFTLGEIIDVGSFDFYDLQANVGNEFSCTYRKYDLWQVKTNDTAKVPTDSLIETVVSC